MNPQEINKRIAIACGWYEEDNESEICWTRHELTYCLHEDELPNYHGDLNAMHEAEKVLTQEQFRHYVETHLWEMLWVNSWTEFVLVKATAAQRAEAFLRTIGQWEDNK